EMVAEMDRLLEDYNCADTARILNEKGFTTGDGLPLTSIAVGYVRKAYGLKSRFDRLRGRGLLNISEMAKACGVSIKTIGHWRQRGLIRAYAINDRTQSLRRPRKQISRRSTLEMLRARRPDVCSRAHWNWGRTYSKRYLLKNPAAGMRSIGAAR